MVELLIGFVCFCGLSLLNAPWSTTGGTNEQTDSRSPIYPNLSLAEVYKSYQKLTLKILKKST
jgi:hypothetical protein